MKQQAIVFGIICFTVGVLFALFFIRTGLRSNMTGVAGMVNMMGISSGSQNMMNSDAIDAHFIEQMIPHHEDAIAMADIALEKSQRQEIKSLANDIKRTQSAEIEQMKKWYKDWFGTDVPEDAAVDGMHGMMGGQDNFEEFTNAPDFDQAFINEMVRHHEMAVMMATMLKNSTSRPEMKELAQNIIDAQTKEINNMRNWYRAWGY